MHLCIIFDALQLLTMKCLQCDKPLSAGRSDKKFCNDYCRQAYNNKRKEQENKEIRHINLALKRNRRILKTLLKEHDEVVTDKETLLRSGFLFEFHTHHVISKKKSNEFLFCYNYGYHLTEGGKYKIVKRFEDADVFV
jgi:hypothetical protein